MWHCFIIPFFSSIAVRLIQAAFLETLRSMFQLSENRECQPKFEPRAAGWEVQTLPLCYVAPPLLFYGKIIQIRVKEITFNLSRLSAYAEGNLSRLLLGALNSHGKIFRQLFTALASSGHTDRPTLIWVSASRSWNPVSRLKFEPPRLSQYLFLAQ